MKDVRSIPQRIWQRNVVSTQSLDPVNVKTVNMALRLDQKPELSVRMNFQILKTPHKIAYGQNRGLRLPKLPSGF